MRHRDVVLSSLCLLLISACGDSKGSPGRAPAGADAGGADSGVAAPSRLVVTADWLNGSLSILDYDALVGGATSRDEALLHTIDLSAHPPGALEVEITPDGRFALASISTGFFGGAAGTFLLGEPVPIGESLLVAVDLQSYEVVAELDVGATPMGIAITPDSTRALVTSFAGNQVSVVDLTTWKVIEQIDVSPGPEQIAVDDSGSVGIVNAAGAGTYLTFALEDIAGTLTETTRLAGDTSGVAFFPGTKTAFTISSYNPLSQGQGGYSLIDVEDPSAPAVLSNVEIPGATFSYAATTLHDGAEALAPTAIGGTLELQRFGLDGSSVNELAAIELGPVQRHTAMNTAVDDTDRFALSAVPGDKTLVVTDLAAGTSTFIPWLGQLGPGYVAVGPQRE